MPDANSAQAAVDAAQQAAAAGDFAAAERLLRKAIQRQETDLGPQHPDLANTLNNLGVLCEMREQPAEAEVCYRRAYEIASAALEPDHPFVITSRKNLTDFCESRGKQLGPPIRVPAATSAQRVDPTPPSPARVVVQPPVVAERAAKQPRFPIKIASRVGIAVIGVMALMLVAIFMRRSADQVGAPANAPEPTRQSSATSAPTPSAAAAQAPSREAAPPSGAGQSERKAASDRVGGAPPPLVASAVLCKGFATVGSPDWRCDPAGGSVSRGSLVYYTRIKSATATTVQHRWYRGENLNQSVNLRVLANPTAGYRTYSRYTVRTEGAWRVELRTLDGALLHEERFDVR